MSAARPLLAGALGAFALAARAETATVYYGGDILTMEGDAPGYVAAVVVAGDRISFAGGMPEAMAAAGPHPILHDLKGHTLLPGFIDTWGHFALVAQDTLGVDLAYFSEDPPRTKAQLVDKLRRKGQPFNGWIVGTGYSDALLSDGAISRAELDAAFPTQPVLIENISTLTGLLNSAGLKKLGITRATKAVSGFIPLDPKTGEPTGELIGMPYLDAVATAVGRYSQELTFETYRRAERIYASHGFTTAQSYEATLDDIRDMRAAAEKRIVSLDLIALPTFQIVDQMLEADPNFRFGTYGSGRTGFKVAGIMVSTDGAPQLRLAYLTKPYSDTTGLAKDWRGFEYYPQSTIDRYARLAYEKNIQFFGYSNGDAGIDMTLQAVRNAIRETGVTQDRRTVVAHAVFARDDQLAEFRAEKIMALMLPNHVWLYGDVFPEIVGEQRAANVAPLRSAQAAGVRAGIHNDTPSSGPDVLFSIWSAVNRKTFGGRTLGPAQRIDPYFALLGFTRNAAYEYREESSKGSIVPGRLADLVELDRNPLKVDPDDIRNIRVVRTVKNGRPLYDRGAPRGEAASAKPTRNAR